MQPKLLSEGTHSSEIQSEGAPLHRNLYIGTQYIHIFAFLPSLLSQRSVNCLSLFQGVAGFLLLEPIPVVYMSPVRGRVHPGQVASPQQQFGFQYLAQGHFNMHFDSPRELGLELVTFQSLADLLYLLSYSRAVLLVLFLKHHDKYYSRTTECGGAVKERSWTRRASGGL